MIHGNNKKCIKLFVFLSFSQQLEMPSSSLLSNSLVTAASSVNMVLLPEIEQLHLYVYATVFWSWDKPAFKRKQYWLVVGFKQREPPILAPTLADTRNESYCIITIALSAPWQLGCVSKPLFFQWSDALCSSHPQYNTYILNPLFFSL